MSYLSNRVNKMAESETLAMTRVANELKAQGLDVISLSIGEPDFDTPMDVKNSAKQAIDDNWTHYPPVSGYPDLKKAIVEKFKRDNNLTYAPNQIVVTNGAKQAIYETVLALVNPGDEVIIPAPYWVSYKEIVKMAEGVPVYIKTTIENDFKITPQQLEAAITQKSKLMMFSTPSNPTGMLYSQNELKAIAEVVAKHPGLLIMSDEIYEHINFEGQHESIAQFDFIYDRVITINGVAKGFAMTGWRIGFLAASPEIAKACDKLQGQITSGACSIAQRAVIEAMKIDPKTSKDIIGMREIFRKRRDMMHECLSKIPNIKINNPQGAFYFFMDISAYIGKKVPQNSKFVQMYNKPVIENSTDLCMYFLYDAQVALVQGEAFGNDDCIRLSYATSEDKLKEAYNRLHKAFVELK